MSAARPRARRVATWLLWLAVLVAVTAGLFVVRDKLDKAHITLAYLLVVLAASAAGGRALGLALAGLAFVAFDYLFLPPYYTFVIANPLDWLVLVAFLFTSVVAAQLLTRAQERAEVAQRRTIEVKRLSELGAETLSAGRAEDALSAIAEVIRGALGVDRCEIHVQRESPPGLVRAARAGTLPDERATRVDAESLSAWVAGRGQAAAERMDGTTRLIPFGDAGERWHELPEVRALLVPLYVRDRAVGVLRISHHDAITLRAGQREFLDALSYYAALGVERVRLVAEAERAEALQQADKLKSALIAGVSHDLRTPLTTIKALAHELALGGDRRASSIEEEADRLNRFVADFLDLSRINAGAVPLRIAIESADDLLGAAVQRVAGTLDGRTVRVVRDAAAPVLVGRFDFVSALRVLTNLIENAAKYSPAGSPIELSVERRGQVLSFAVADRGPGVPDAERERIFEPFYRPAGVRPDVGGVGLGLAIARGLAVAQGGAVRYEPRDAGGSVFRLELPAEEAPVL